MSNLKIVGISVPCALVLGLGSIAFFDYVSPSKAKERIIDKETKKLLEVVRKSESFYDDAVSIFNKAIVVKDKIIDSMYESGGMFYSTYKHNHPIYDEVFILLDRAEEKVDEVEKYVYKNKDVLDWVVELFIYGTFDGGKLTGTSLDISGTKSIKESIRNIRRITRNLSE